MKASFLAAAIFGLLILSATNLRAQVYSPYYYGPYWDAQYQYLQYQNYLQWQQYLDYLRQTVPYYDLHVLHYQLYLQPYESYQIYPPCCYAFGLPMWSAPIIRGPHGPRTRLPKSARRR